VQRLQNWKVRSSLFFLHQIQSKWLSNKKLFTFQLSIQFFQYLLKIKHIFLNRISELVQTGDGIAIVESGLSLGGGYLQ
jgi:hypothetical protein